MSVEFTFAGSSLTVDACDEVLQTWSEARDEALFAEPCFVRRSQLKMVTSWRSKLTRPCS